MFLGLSVNGRMVSFAENVFYEFRRSKIASVWSIIDKSAIEGQLSRRRVTQRTTYKPSWAMTASGGLLVKTGRPADSTLVA
jgi:hypothetical protein